MKNKIQVVFETKEEDESIFKSALEYGLEKAGTKAKIIQIGKIDENRN